MTGDRWSVGEKWSIGGAALYGGLVGPPLQVVQNVVMDDNAKTLSERPEYLVLGVVVGAVAFVIGAIIRNQIVNKSDG
jgi:hypothetical protein